MVQFLLNPHTVGAVFWWDDERKTFESIRDTLLADLVRVGDALSTSVEAADVLELLVEHWAGALARTDSRALFEDRRLLLHCALSQAIITIGVGWPEMHLIASRLPEAARTAAARVLETGSTWERDPVVEIARIATDVNRQSEPRIFLAPPGSSGEFLESARVPELADLFQNVWSIGTSTEQLLRDLAIELASARGNDPFLAFRANEVAPEFVRSRGSIEIQDSEDDVVVAFCESDQPERLVLLGDLGEGVKRWVAISVLVAAREMRASAPTGLFLIDEPEAHLHISAIRELRTWLVDRHREGSGVIAATHTVELLDLPTEIADFFIVIREDGVSRFTKIGDAVIQSLDAKASSLGINRSDALRVARGFLIVEGEQDELVIERFFGYELRQARVLVLRLEGTGNVRAFVELQYLSRLGLPMAVLLDSVRPDFREQPKRSWSQEEQKIAGLPDDVRLKIVSHALPDVIFCLPDEAVSIVAPTFPGWQTTLARYRSQSRRREFKLKTFLGEQLGLRNEDGSVWVPGTSFVSDVLNVCTTEDGIAPGLQRAIQEALAHISGR